jgi:hypothetical protein
MSSLVQHLAGFTSVRFCIQGKLIFDFLCTVELNYWQTLFQAVFSFCNFFMSAFEMRNTFHRSPTDGHIRTRRRVTRPVENYLLNHCRCSVFGKFKRERTLKPGKFQSSVMFCKFSTSKQAPYTHDNYMPKKKHSKRSMKVSAVDNGALPQKYTDLV